jgi:hypothetical protein
LVTTERDNLNDPGKISSTTSTPDQFDLNVNKRKAGNETGSVALYTYRVR